VDKVGSLSLNVAGAGVVRNGSEANDAQKPRDAVQVAEEGRYAHNTKQYISK
jgi:hypothetical protein